MGDTTHISWTDATWSPVTGCTRVSPGCERCYIDRCPPRCPCGETQEDDGECFTCEIEEVSRG